MLRSVAWTTGLAGATSGLLLFTLFLLAPLPANVAWPLATLAVTLAFVSIGGLAWAVLTLPPGAPWRVTGLRTAVALCGGGLLLLFALGSRTGAAGSLALLGGVMGLAAAWRPGSRVMGWSAVVAAVALPLASVGVGPLVGGAALGLTGTLLVMEER